MTTVTVARRHAGRLAAIGALAILATACPVDPPVVTYPSWPSPANLTAITPGGSSFGGRQLSDDGRWFTYTRYNPDTFQSDPYLWDATTGTSVLLAEPAESGPSGSITPTVSSDGSTVYFSALQDQVVPGRTNDGRSLFRYDTATGGLDQFDQPEDHPFGRRITEVASSRDGSVVGVELGTGTFRLADVAVWTEAGGYEIITDHQAVEDETVWGYDLPGAAVSENGRYVAAVAQYRPSELEHQPRLQVYDRVAETWSEAWAGAVHPPEAGYAETVRVMAVLDDGSLIFDVSTPSTTSDWVSQGVRLWDAPAGVLSQLVPADTGAMGFSASADGRFVGYTGSDHNGPPGTFGTPWILDRNTGTRLQSGSRNITAPIAISGGATSVVLFTFDAAINPTPGGNAFLQWDRTA